MHYHICFNRIERVILILNDQATSWSDISEYLQKNESRNIKDFHIQDYMLSLHFGSLSGTKSSTLFFLFTRNNDWIADNIHDDSILRLAANSLAEYGRYFETESAKY